MDDRDLYEILEVSNKNSVNEIKASYHKLLLKHHPDKSSISNQNVEEFLKIQNAWNLLSNEEDKVIYDLKNGFKKKSLLFGEEFSIQDFHIDEESYYIKACRCGDNFEFHIENIERGNKIPITCNGCSLQIIVVF